MIGSANRTGSFPDTAERVCEKHCALKDRLVSLGVDPKSAEQDACGIEHIVSNESLEKTKALWMKPVTGD